MTDRGVIFVATQRYRYVEEAFLAAASAKHHAPGLPVTLFTDRPDNSLCGAGCFDTVEKIESAQGGDARANAQINRITGLTRTPYERTLYLDTDARVVEGDIPGLFDLLDDCDVAMVEDELETSKARRTSGRRMFNCGVILYDRARSPAWLKAWETLTLRNLALARETPTPFIPELTAVTDDATRQWLLEVDKIALLGVLPPDRPQTVSRVATLDGCWNYRKPVARSGVNIHHPHDRVGSLAEDIGKVACAWAADGRENEAATLRDYLAAL